jgi:metal-responsive CopG/Arc/MetJ family transcriptional regulator
MDPRGERLQIMLTKEELVALDNWRFDRRMPSRAAAVRELLRRGLDAEGFAVSDGRTKSGDFSVVSPATKPETDSEAGSARLRASK